MATIREGSGILVDAQTLHQPIFAPPSTKVDVSSRTWARQTAISGS